MQLDLRDPVYQADPYPTLAHLRSIDPVHMDAMGIWYVLRHADVVALNRDPRLGRDLRKWLGYPLLRPYLADSPLERCVEQFMFSLDPPHHTRLRRLVARAFTPRAIEAMRTDIERVADELLGALEASGRPSEIEFLSAFARPFPVRVIARVLGLPDETHEQLRQWSNTIATVVEPTSRRSMRLAANAAVVELVRYLTEQVACRRERRDGDVISMLVTAEDGDRLTEEELVSQLVLMFVAGHETTTNLLGNGLLALCRHPLEMQRLRDDLDLVPGAVEEMLRYDSPANTNARVAHEQLVVAGKTIAAGQLVLCMLGAANRDPAVFVEPDRFDITRTPNPHQSFGGGIHHCLGAALSRLEAQVAFERLLRRFPTIQAIEDGVQWRTLVNLRGMEQLPVRVRWA